MNFPFFSLFFLKDSTLSSTVESNGVAQTLSEKKTCVFLCSRFAYHKDNGIPNGGLHKTKDQNL